MSSVKAAFTVHNLVQCISVTMVTGALHLTQPLYYESGSFEPCSDDSHFAWQLTMVEVCTCIYIQSIAGWGWIKPEALKHVK